MRVWIVIASLLALSACAPRVHKAQSVCMQATADGCSWWVNASIVPAAR